MDVFPFLLKFQRWSGQPLINRLLPRFPPELHICQSAIWQNAEPHIAPGDLTASLHGNFAPISIRSLGAWLDGTCDIKMIWVLIKIEKRYISICHLPFHYLALTVQRICIASMRKWWSYNVLKTSKMMIILMQYDMVLSQTYTNIFVKNLASFYIPWELRFFFFLL